MKRSPVLLFVLSMGLLGLSASGCAVDEPEEERTAALAVQVEKQVSPLRDFNTFEEVDGAIAWLHREDGVGVEVEVTTTAEPGDAITLFMVAFNNTDACQYPAFNIECTVPDLGDPATEASMMWAGAGTVAGEGGEVELESFVEAGNEPGEIVFGPGYVNPDAELHFIVRTKGAAGDNVDEQVSTLNGGCDVNDCADLQFALFARK